MHLCEEKKIIYIYDEKKKGKTQNHIKDALKDANQFSYHVCDKIKGVNVIV